MGKKYSFVENVVKARIAETLVEEMFKNSGYIVYRIGYEAIIESLPQLRQQLRQQGKDLKDRETLYRIRSIPDFLVISQKGSAQLIEVKYSKNSNLPKKDLKKYIDFWKEARILIVCPTKPHFLINYIENFCSTNKLYPLEKDRYTTIKPEIIERFSEVVKEYFKE